MSLLGLASVVSSVVVGVAGAALIGLVLGPVGVVGPEESSAVSLIWLEAGSEPWPILSGLPKNPIKSLLFF